MRVRTSMSGKMFTLEFSKAEGTRLIKNISEKFNIKIPRSHDVATKFEQLMLEVLEYDLSSLSDV